MKTFRQFVEDYAAKVAQLRSQQQQHLQVSQQRINTQRQQHQSFVDKMNQDREDAIERRKLKDEIKRELETER